MGELFSTGGNSFFGFWLGLEGARRRGSEKGGSLTDR